MSRMRRRDREITTVEEMREVLDACKVLRIGMYDEDGIYILPMNFGYEYDGKELVFYLHGALEGKKLDLLQKCATVGFELDCNHELIEGKVACQYGYRYASIVGKGKADIITDSQEKIKAMMVLMQGQTGKGFTFDERLVSIVSVIKINAVVYSGKKRE